MVYLQQDDNKPIEQCSMLPEVVPGEHPEVVSQEQPKYVVQPSQDNTFKYPHDLPPQAPPNRYTALPFLLIYALLIAIFSGLIGGFIGKVITDSRSNVSTRTDTITAHCPDRPPTRNSTNDCTSPAPKALNNVLNNNTISPVTDCPNNNGLTQQSSITKTSFRKYCNVNWYNADIMWVFTLSMSDCIEACAGFNELRTGTGSWFCVPGPENACQVKECVGAVFSNGFAMDRNGSVAGRRYSANCFLKYDITWYPENDQPSDGNGGVGLCLEEKCPRD